MDKKSKEMLRRYKKSRQPASSSDSSSSSDSDSGSSYSSSDSERKAAERHRKKKAARQAGAARRSSSSSGDERRKREKKEHCQKKLEAKRNHLKRKLKEAKLKKRAAAAAAALSGHSHRALSPATQAKLKKLAERKHQRAASKERREREREKHRAAAAREREHRGGSRSPTKITKIRIHQDVKRQKSPPRMHHQLMSREKIIIQTRTRDRTPSADRERQRREHKLRHDEVARERERREQEVAREKERSAALARCQERARERERLAREKLRREEEDKKYGSLSVERGERLLPHPVDREIAIAAARGYNSRERSLEAVERTRHLSKRELDVYEREREYLEAERRGLLDREELRREREYLVARRRELSPVGEHYAARMHDPREMYPEEDRERAYGRAYLDEVRHPREREAWLDSRELRERELHDLHDPRDFRDMMYAEERERTLAVRGDWKTDWEPPRERGWDDAAPSGRGGFIGGPKRGVVGPSSTSVGPPKLLTREKRVPSEPDWDAEEGQIESGSGLGGNKPDAAIAREKPVAYGGISGAQREQWIEHDQRDLPPVREKLLPGGRPEHGERRWQPEWHENDDAIPARGNTSAISMHHHRSERGGRGFRRGGGNIEHGYRGHPPSLMTLPVQAPNSGFHGASPRFPNKRNMTYTNPNLLKKQQAVLAAKAAATASAVAAATAVAAAKAAAQSAANATTNPGILGQVSGVRPLQASADETPEAGEILADDNVNKPEAEVTQPKPSDVNPFRTKPVADSIATGELSEISDSDDDILNKAEKKPKAETDELTQTSTNSAPATVAPSDAGITPTDAACKQEGTECVDAVNKADDEEMPDFEEISDGELEEDARNKGVGDALGVDWASLIAETKRQAENAAPNISEQPTSAKQKWQAHRIILDIGISMRMAGEEYAKRLLNNAKQKLDEELSQINNEPEIKDEICSTADEDSQTVTDLDDNTADNVAEKKPKLEATTPQQSFEELNGASINVERLHPLAFVQVAERKRLLERRKLIANACGANSRALSARQDLKLRRQLCGLPAREYNLPHPLPVTSATLKAKALAAFQRALEVK